MARIFVFGLLFYTVINVSAFSLLGDNHADPELQEHCGRFVDEQRNFREADSNQVLRRAVNGVGVSILASNRMYRTIGTFEAAALKLAQVHKGSTGLKGLTQYSTFKKLFDTLITEPCEEVSSISKRNELYTEQTMEYDSDAMSYWNKFVGFCNEISQKNAIESVYKIYQAKI